MNTDEHAVRDLLAPHDPASAVRVGAEQLARARVDAVSRGAFRTPGARVGAPRFRWRLALLGATAVVAALAVVGVSALRTTSIPAYAGPPPPPLAVAPSDLADAREELLALARTAEAQSAPAPGDVAYVRTSQVNLTLVQDADAEEAGAGVVSVDSQAWRPVEEDMGYLVERPVRPPEHLEGDESPLRNLFERGPREREREWLALTWKPGELSTDPERLEAQLVPPQWTPDTVNLFTSITRLYGERPVTPEEQGTILRALAGHDDVRFAGTATDREGRSGQLFLVEDTDQAEGRVVQKRIMFDPDTGMPLYHETVVMESDQPVPSGQLPQVNQYTVLVASAWVDEVGQRP